MNLIFRLTLLPLIFTSPLLYGDQPAPPNIRPPFLINAEQDEIRAQVILHSDSKPEAADFTAGLLVSQQPNFTAQPTIVLLGAAPGIKNGDYAVELSVEALMPFGESSLPLFYQGTQVDLLRFSRPGVGVSPASGSTFVARQSGLLLLVIDNHSAFAYKQVRGRLRFQDHDFCEFKVATSNDAPNQRTPIDCANESQWEKFEIPQYAQLTLRATHLPAEWFRDSGSDYARSGKSAGTLTLHFTAAQGGQNTSPPAKVHEQILPIEVQFEPSNAALARTIAKIFGLLLLGAAFSFLLRVSLPNMKRKRMLKDQLAEENKQIAGLSGEVDSRLRTLLGSECLALDELRTETFPVAPNYAEYAKRVEQGIPILSRKISVVQRLGSALERKRTRINSGHEYRILEDAGFLLDCVSRMVQKNQIGDEDWLSINQDLAKAEKLLEEPSRQARDAFEGGLAARWQAVREHFGVKDGKGALTEGLWRTPATLDDMRVFFDLLPKEFCAGDVDGFKRWMKDGANTEGDAPADVLVSAFEHLRYVETIVPPKKPSAGWDRERESLLEMLRNPTTQKLFEAKAPMWRLSDNVFKEDIKKALEDGHARLIVDPENPAVNRNFRIAVRLLDEHLDTASAREQLKCRWTIETAMRGRRLWLQPWKHAESIQETHEEGWHAFHYFQNGSIRAKITVAFADETDSVHLPTDKIQFPSVTVIPVPNWRGREKYARTILEITQLAAALLIPLAAIASNTLTGGGEGRWWTLATLGFGTDTIKNIILGKDDTAPPAAK